MVQVTIIGAGVAGLCCALELAERGAAVEVLERAAAPGPSGCSWCAGGMLAPWCELEDSGAPLIEALGRRGVAWWCEQFPQALAGGTRARGTLVVAQRRDAAELARFARGTRGFEWLQGEALGRLEPELAGRFGQGLYFAGEAHLDPRRALAHLRSRLLTLGGTVRFGVEEALGTTGGAAGDRCVIDCRGLAARDVLPDLRGVRGEMLLLRSRELALSRPVRLLHPRWPVYVVPRGDGVFMVGATMIESDATGGVSARSMQELLAAAQAVHPAFGEAEVLELAAQVRPAFADNLPRLRWRGGRCYVNGLYRHGFLLAPALAAMAAEALLAGRHFPEVMDEDSAQRRSA